MDAANGGENLAPGLASVKYKTILPMGKQSQYVENERVQFDIPPEIGYFDGKQSYLNIVVRNTTMSNSSTFPVCFPPHIGAHSLFNRVQLQDTRGMEMENIESYNTYTGILNSYCNDSDTYKTISKVEGIAAHNPLVNNRAINDPKVNYFVEVPSSNVSANVVAAIGSKPNTFCLPINLGLFSAFANEHMAYPNLDVGGSRLTLYLETAQRILNSMAHNAPTVAGSGATKLTYRLNQAITTYLPGVAKLNGDVSSVEFGNNAGFSFNDLPEGDIIQDYTGIGFRPGMEIEAEQAGTFKASVSNVLVDAAGNVVVNLTSNIGVLNGTSLDLNVRVVPPTSLSYVIDKIELKVLETIPMPQTISQIRKAMMRGINFQSTQLTKISTASQLVNAIVDIPSTISRGLSIWSVPVSSEYMNSRDDANTLMYPQIDSNVSGNDNEIEYQYQVRNILVPNRSVRVSRTRSTTFQNDNPTYYNQQAMALRPMREAKCLGESTVAHDLSNPFFIPILLAPQGSSFSLIDTDPLLRIENTQTGDLSKILQKLYHVYINHTRTLIANDSGVDVSI